MPAPFSNGLSRRAWLAALGSLPLPARAGAPRKSLLLDRRVVERAEGVRLLPGPVRKEPANPLFGEDKPWEPRFDNLYANLLRDPADGLYKCWYSPFIVDSKTTGTPRSERAAHPYLGQPQPRREMGICYAVSKDGIAWQKPELGLVEFNGSRRNNLVLRADPQLGEPHGAGIWRDDNDPDPRRRYKMVFNRAGRGPRFMSVGFSADGLHWDRFVEARSMEAPGDTHNNWFWAPSLQRYVAITRLFQHKPSFARLVARSESTDFVQWSKAEVVLRALPDEPKRQTYAMPAFPYENVYLGLVMMINVNGRYDTVDCELAWSPDTVHWERIAPGVPLIPRGEAGSSDSGCIYAAFRPVVLDDGIRLYYGASNGEHGDYRDGFLCLAHLRKDGFAGYAAERAAGRVVTVPQTAGRTLRINADARGGSVTVRVLSADGREVARSRAVQTDATDAAVPWQHGRLSKAEPVRLEFTLHRAQLYSYTWVD